MKGTIAEILNLNKRSVTGIVQNEKLCKRIINEKPIKLNEAAEKYNLTPSFIKRKINENLLSWFQNSPHKGSVIFIFENELNDLIGKEVQYISAIGVTNIINRTIETYFVILKLILQPKDYDITYDFIINKIPVAMLMHKHDLGRERIRQILNRARTRMVKYVNTSLEYDELINQVYELKDIKNNIEDYLEKVNKNQEDLIERFNILYKTKIEDINMSTRLYNVLRSSDINFLEELKNYSYDDMLKFRNFGKQTLKELQNVCHKYGAKMRGEN